MISFHDKQELKDDIRERVTGHMVADELIRGTGYEGGRGCAVGCTLNSYDHSAYPGQLGLPEWLAYLEDAIHEQSSEAVWPTFAYDMIDAIPVGVDVDAIRKPLLARMQRRNLARVAADSEVASAIRGVIDWLEGDDDEDKRIKVLSTARLACTAAWAARSTAQPATWAAVQSAARSTAQPAVQSAARSSAWSAARSSAWSSAWSSSWSAAQSAVARSAAWSVEYDLIAADLLELLRGLQS